MSGIIVGAAVGAAVGGGSAIYGISKSNRNKIKAFKLQMKYLQLNYNYNQAALDKQEKSMYDSAMVELFGLSMNAYQNNAQIEAAIAETGLEGRSQEKIQQVIHGQTSRQKTAIKESYKQGVWEVRGQKEALYITTKNEVEQARASLKSNLVGGTQAFMQVMSSAVQGAALGAATAGAASAAGGALGGATGGAAGGASGALVSTPQAALASGSSSLIAGGTSTTVLGTGAINTSATGMLSSYGTATLGASTGSATAGTGSALMTGINTGSALGAVGSVTQPVTSATSSSSSSLGTSFLGRFNTLYTQYKPWIDFYANIGKLGGQIDTKTRRGGYFY